MLTRHKNPVSMPVSTDATTFPTYTVQVNDTSAIWVYCRQTSHCGQGMVFAANADETGGSGKSFEAFKASAMQLNGTSNSTGSSSSGQNGAGAVRLGGTGVALSIVAVIVGLMF